MQHWHPPEMSDIESETPATVSEENFETYQAGRGVKKVERTPCSVKSEVAPGWGQKTQPSTKRCKKATSKRLAGIHLSRTNVLSTAAMILRSC